MIVSDYYIYKEKKYPVFDIYIWKYKGWYKISVESLADAISPEGDFEDCDGEGEWIDQQLFFYIPDELQYKGKKEVMDYLNTQL